MDYTAHDMDHHVDHDMDDDIKYRQLTGGERGQGDVPANEGRQGRAPVHYQSLHILQNDNNHHLSEMDNPIPHEKRGTQLPLIHPAPASEKYFFHFHSWILSRFTFNMWLFHFQTNRIRRRGQCNHSSNSRTITTATSKRNFIYVLF